MIPGLTSAQLPSRWKGPTFRLAAILLALSPFLVFEAVCIRAGWGLPANFDDPYVGFRELQPLFALNDAGTHYEIPPARRRFFHPESFPVSKGKNEFRIFVLGGSTVAGEPFASETSFTTWLELALAAADQRRDWNVINCGGISYASYRLAPILEECLAYEPDLLILCTGHNEFLEDRTYSHLKIPESLPQTAVRGIGRLRTVTLARAGFDWWTSADRPSPGAPASMLPAEVDARLDYSGGLSQYRRDEAWADQVTRHFRLNLERMITRARNAGLPVMMILEPSNLADCPPFKSEHSVGMSDFDVRTVDEIVASSRDLLHNSLSQAAFQLSLVLKLDHKHARTWYELGKCCERMGEHRKAREAFVKARDLDVCPLRMTSPLEHTIRDVSKAAGIRLVDAHQLLEQKTTAGILGDFWLVDHVHPSITGHQLIAQALLDELIRSGIVHPGRDSESCRKQSFERHLASLPAIYFERGQRTLELLQGWARGRAEGSDGD